MRWTHQLVFQFDASTLEDFDQLTALELAIESGLPKSAHLDGHDSGCGEFNVFIHTHDPVAIFEHFRELIGRQYPGVPFRAGYRGFNQDEYTAVWPPSSTQFVVS